MKKTIIKSLAELQNWFINKPEVCSYDWETAGLQYTEMEPVGISFCDGKRACYVDLMGDFQKELLSYLGNLFNLENILWIAHNQVFDLKCCFKFCSTSPKKIFCSLIGAKLIDERRTGKGSYSLKRLAKDWLHVSPDEIKTWDEVSHLKSNTKEFANYAMNDSIWAWDLYELEKRKFKEQNLLYLFNQIEMPFQFVIRDMEINGIKVDQDKLRDFEIKTADELLRIEREMLKIFGLKHFIQRRFFGNSEYISPINFGSSKQLVDLIEYQLGFFVDVYTKKSKMYPKGQKSVAKEFLIKMQGKHPFFDLLWKYRKYLKLMNGFIEPCSDFIESDGKIRPSFHLIRSGRLSCSEPNLQQLPNPKREKLLVNYREIFVPGPENVFVKGDYEGQELRVLAEISQDKTLIDAFNRNVDVHLFFANYNFKLGLTDVQMCTLHPEYKAIKERYESERYKAKNGTNFPVVYGTTAQGISKRMGVTVEEARDWMANFFELFPDVLTAMDNTKDFLIENNYVATLMGRKRRFSYFAQQSKRERARMLRAAFNHRIQGFSADEKKIAAINCLKILDDYQAKIVMDIHDELIFECPIKQAEGFAAKLKEIMEQAICISIKMPVSVSIEENLG